MPKLLLDRLPPHVSSFPQRQIYLVLTHRLPRHMQLFLGFFIGLVLAREFAGAGRMLNLNSCPCLYSITVFTTCTTDGIRFYIHIFVTRKEMVFRVGIDSYDSPS